MKSASDLLASVERHIGPVATPYRAALLAVDRTRFVRIVDRDRAYVDEPLPLDTPAGPHLATVSAPHVYALAFAALALSRGDDWLELGSGSGYGASLASEVVGPTGHVTSIEVDPLLAQISQENTIDRTNVAILVGDGLTRPDLVARHRKTWLTFAVREVPGALLAAIPEGGALLAPVGPPSVEQRFVRHVRRDGRIVAEDLGAVRFVAAR